MGASVKELIEKAEKVAAMGTRGPLGTGVFSGEDKLVWSDGLAGQTVAVCTAPADAQKFVAAVELLPALAAELCRLTEWRDIAEAPRDGTWVLAYWDETARKEPGRFSRFLVAQWLDSEWRDGSYDELSKPTHFRLLPEGPR
jgi:hypothetical protein